ncbi:adenosylcobinamide-GDP ribazoletransferase [Moraxella marmotae]|uniref:adenosylcobinamide-GDP ribazoletransferase n=1 Tax=Moraxella marmotae TaxID=3344520 RepID=UPI0035F37FD3
MNRILMPFLIAVQFLTIFPITLPVIPSRDQNAKSLLFHPLIGLAIGGVLYLLAMSHLPMILTSAAVVAMWAWLTGGLHLDGLADTTDAWVGGFGDRERTLTIMKDTHTGAMGVIAIVVIMLLKFAAVYSLIEQQQMAVLIFAPMLGRLSVLMMFASTPYVRSGGIGSAFGDVAWRPLVAVILLYLMGLWLLPVKLALGLGLGLVLTVAFLRYIFVKRIGGITGDTLGAGIELVEMMSVILAVVLGVV